jgi:hypothetical protein
MRQRPISITVFGILNIGDALWKFGGLLLAGFMMRMKLPGNSTVAAMNSDPLYRAWLHYNIGISVGLGFVLVASGIGLLLVQNWARILAVVYSVVEMIVVVVGNVIAYPVLKHSMTTIPLPGASPALIAVIFQFSFILGIVLGLAYPVLLLVFMTRPKIIEAFHWPNGQQIH